jgi:hypothetical protein
LRPRWTPTKNKMKATMLACLAKSKANQEELEANQGRIDTVAEHYEGALLEKATHIVSATQDRAADVLHKTMNDRRTRRPSVQLRIDLGVSIRPQGTVTS